MKNPTPFQKKALDFTSNILLSANAGSGKTFVLSKRFVEILLNENIEIDNVVAITFTDKAAGELNKKIANELNDRIENEKDPGIIGKLVTIKRQLVFANISTIHSFCVDILREFSPDANIDANFIPIDSNTAEDLIELSVDETITSLLNSQDESNSIKYLFRLLGSKNRVASVIQKSIDRRRNIEKLIEKIYQNSVHSIANSLSEIIEEYNNSLFNKIISDVIGNIEFINNKIVEVEPTNEIGLNVKNILENISSELKFENLIHKVNEIFGLIMTAGSNQTVRKVKYLGKKGDELSLLVNQLEQSYDELKPILAADFSPKATLELANFGKCFSNVFKKANDLYLAKKKQHGYLDYEDLLLFVLRIIEKTDVIQYLRNKYRYIMIDEYQDTDEIQYNIFMPILDFLKHGNLFVVGDEKQSIYMFRDAELGVFNETKQQVQNDQLNGKILNLPHSFRMSPNIVLFINKLFKKLFENPNPLFNEVNYSDLICAVDPNEKGAVEFLISTDEEESNEVCNIGNKIIELVNSKKLKFNEIGILCRKRKYFAELENHFAEKNIPFVVVGGKGFYQRQTVYDIYNYLSFLINIDDDKALVGILRSPFFLLSDKQLLLISLEEGNTFYAKLKSYCRKNELSKIIEKLDRHIKLASSLESYNLLRTILNESGYWAVIASKKNSEQEIANLEKMISIARDFSTKSFKTLFDFTLFLRDSIELSDDEGQAQVTEEKNAVNLLTIHQAKGLEYKCIFLFKCNENEREDSVKAKTIMFDKNFGFLAKVHLDKKYFLKPATPALVAYYNYINKKEENAEFKRLLYVALTRAMNYLYITATINSNKVNNYTFLNLISQGLNIKFVEDKLLLSDEVEFMEEINGKYEFSSQDISTEVLISKKINNVNLIESISNGKQPPKKYLVHRIKDYAKKEIISATKISMYNQCPVKYQLTYEIGFSSLLSFIKNEKKLYEFNDKEDSDLKLYAAMKGKIIHSLLNENVTVENLESSIEKKISYENLTDFEKAKLTRNIKILLELYLNSKSYSQISEFNNYKNEYEIYCEEGEHYLYGIIDKVIFHNDKIIVIDYKTDSVDKNEIINRAESYFHQLKFYAYLLSKLYPDTLSYEIQLLFLNHPDTLISQNITNENLSNFKIELNEAIRKIHENSFSKNYNHCSKCHFSIEGNKCVLP
jgi:ATP-dependent helicase/nuclease subunit A